MPFQQCQPIFVYVETIIKMLTSQLLLHKGSIIIIIYVICFWAHIFCSKAKNGFHWQIFCSLNAHHLSSLTSYLTNSQSNFCKNRKNIPNLSEGFPISWSPMSYTIHSKSPLLSEHYFTDNFFCKVTWF